MSNRTPLTKAEIETRLADLSGWSVEDGLLKKTFAMSSYPAGLAFAAAVGTICEGFDHHPEQLCIGFKQVEVSFITHDAGDAITGMDFDVAAAIEALPFRKP